MNSQAQTFIKHKPGYTQFCEQYNLAADDPKTRMEYEAWTDQLFPQEGKPEYAQIYGYAENYVKGYAKGFTEGYNTAMESIAQEALAQGVAIEVVASFTKLPISTIESLKESLKI